MEFLNFALILIVSFEITGYFNRLNNKINTIRNTGKGVNEMSKICNELVGKKCIFSLFGENIVIDSMPVCTILDVDEQFIKVLRKGKKDKERISIIRIDDIRSIELVEE